MAYRPSRGLAAWRGMGDLTSDIAFAIAQMEGFNTPGTLAQRNNNPGNLRSGPGQIRTSGGFAVFPDAQTGWDALDNQVNLNISRGLTLQQFFAGGNGYPGYAPSSDANNPAQYASFVGSQAGIPTDVSLLSLQGSSASMDSSGSPSTDLSSLLDLSTIDTSGVSPWLIGGLVLAGLGVVWALG